MEIDSLDSGSRVNVDGVRILVKLHVKLKQPSNQEVSNSLSQVDLRRVRFGFYNPASRSRFTATFFIIYSFPFLISARMSSKSLLK